jgi:sortase A
MPAPRSTLAGREALPRTIDRQTTARGGSEVGVRRLLRAAGWTFIAMGCFVLYFLVYQLVGTDLITNREQSNLQRNLAREWSGPAAPSKRGAALPVPQAPGMGKPLAVLQIPKLNLNKVVVQGANPEQLALGPGHIPSTVMPGQPGTFAISGHRTTHGRPFYNLNELSSGDTIKVVTRFAIYTYKVTHFQVVAPTAVEVLDNVGGPGGKPLAQIVLTTCNPRFSAAQRLIVFGDLSSSVANTEGVGA